MESKEKAKIVFIRNINIDIPYDFNQEVKDEIENKSYIKYYNRDFKIEIDDFLYLVKIKNLTQISYSQLIENSFNLNFITLNLDLIKGSERKASKLNAVTIKNFRFPPYWFNAISQEYEFISKTESTITILLNTILTTFDIQKLKNASITYKVIAVA